MPTKININKLHPNWQIPDFEEAIITSKKNKYCVLVFVINEGKRVREQLEKMKNLTGRIDIVIADGGSVDNSLDLSFLEKVGVRALLTKTSAGRLSTQMRMAFAWALYEGYKGVVTIDGNNKDDTSAIPAFVKLLEKGYDHIQGSRFIPGGKAINTPVERLIGLHLIHAPLISLAARKKHTDTTNGFRAYSEKLLRDSDVNIFRNIFETYELHYYLAIEASRRKKYKTVETPVIRIYPKRGKTPTKISPIKGNAHVLSVLFNAVLGKYKYRRQKR